MRALGAAGLAALAATVLIAAPAQAGRTQLSVFQDDLTLVLSGDAVRERALDDLLALGADTVHSIVFWNRIAPYADRRARPPRSFDATDPAAYPAGSWDRYDGLVRGAVARGMDLILSPASPIPRWASGCPRASASGQRTCRPNPTQFKRFVQALGRRYSGEYSDENQGRGVLPRVSRWSVWNEPNQGGWLTPQRTRARGRTTLASPEIYRGLVRAALKGLRASGHAGDDILIGETAPIGRVSGPLATRPTPPGEFWRSLLCLSATEPGCRPFGPRLAVTGIAHHPYTRGGSRPPTDRGTAKEITISSISRLTRIVDAAARKRRVPRGLGVWYTEFGFQTNPPDTLFGVSPARQATWINQADWLAWRDRRVRAVAQYELRDERPLAAFQTGLQYASGRHKPAFDAYRMPIWVTPGTRGRLRIWGQVRPADDGAVEPVEIQHRAPGETDFATVATVYTTTRKGYLQAAVDRRPGVWRLSWTPEGGGATVTSRTARVGG